MFVPSVPVLLGLASELEAQRDHVLGKPQRPEEVWNDAELNEANKVKDEPGEQEKAFTSLGADAELDQLIYEGATYSADEEDYLGLPGLLEPDQVRTLLSQRQADWIAKGSPRSGFGRSAAWRRRRPTAHGYHHPDQRHGCADNRQRSPDEAFE